MRKAPTPPGAELFERGVDVDNDRLGFGVQCLGDDGADFGFLVDETFLIGYGLGAVEQTNRNLPYLGVGTQTAPMT